MKRLLLALLALLAFAPLSSYAAVILTSSGPSDHAGPNLAAAGSGPSWLPSDPNALKTLLLPRAVKGVRGPSLVLNQSGFTIDQASPFVVKEGTRLTYTGFAVCPDMALGPDQCRSALKSVTAWLGPRAHYVAIQPLYRGLSRYSAVYGAEIRYTYTPARK